MAKRTRKLTRAEISIARVAQVIKAGRVLAADDVQGRCRRTVGPYHEAVDRGARFAVLVENPRLPDRIPPEHRCSTADDAAEIFVLAVGTTRANDASRAAARRHRITLST